MNQSIPLFAIGQPLFPNVGLNLQVFEQRYLRLVRDSMRRNEPFGIVANAIDKTATGEEMAAIYHVGLEVEIVDWRQQENGLLGITVLGENRFSVLSVDVEEDGLMLAEAEPYEDVVEGNKAAGDEFDGLRELLTDLGSHPSLNWFDIPDDMPKPKLIWKLAQVLPVSVEQKMDLLVDRSIESRLKKIQMLIESLSTI